MSSGAAPNAAEIVLTAEQIQRRLREMARQISDDYAGRTLHVVCVLENAFIFMADLVRHIEVPLVCHFMKRERRETQHAEGSSVEVFFSPEIEVAGADVLLLECLVQSGVTTEFLMRNLAGRRAASVRVAALLDRQTHRRVSLQPDYFGFLVEDHFLVGYGLGQPQVGRNLPYIARAAGSVLGASVD